MKTRSDNRARQERDYAVMHDQFLTDNPWCEGCGSRATEIQHSRGRQGWRLLYVPWWVPICRDCHQWATDNPTDAEKAGLSASRLAVGE